MNDGWAGFVIFLLADPHLLEGGEGGKDGATDPYGVFAFWWGDDLDLHCGWGKRGYLFLHSVGNTGEHGGATRHNSVGVQVFTDVDVTLHDTVVASLVDPGGFHPYEGGLVKRLWAPESLVTDGDDLSVGKFVALLE